MQAVHFTSLQSNLSEIYAALHARSGDDLSLYATSLFSVYFQECLPGKILTIYHKTWCWIQPLNPSFSVEKTLERIITTLFDHAVHCAYDARQRRICHNMWQINQIWKSSLQSQDFAKQRKCYVDYIAEELKESSEADNPLYLVDFDARASHDLNEQEVKALRHTIVNFHQATYLFWFLFVKDKEDNAIIRQPLMDLLQPSSTLTDRAFFKALKKEGRWVQMEGIMQQSIPVDLFAKLEGSHSLTVNENKRLKQWAQKLNSCQQDISPRIFSCVLSEIMNIIHLQGSSTLTLPDLLAWLDQQDCQILQQEDPAHMDWREKLQPGDTIECNGKELILGYQLGQDKLINDTFKIFELENYPDYVVKIACNRLLLLIEGKKAENKENWGVRLVETIVNLEEDTEDSIVSGLDQKGRCVVLEKLSNSFDSYVWTSKDLELTREDEKFALVFANHIFCMSERKATSKNLSLSHLMWDKKGVLKSTRLLKKGAANYNDWETYCEKAARGNPYVLSFLMYVSKLNEHEVALYYRKAVEYTWETGKTNLIGCSLPLGHPQEIYNQHIKTLCAQAQELRQKCLKTVMAFLRKKNQYSYQKEVQLQQAVADKLLKFYRASPTPGRFPPDLEQKVIESFNKESKNSSFLDPSDAQDYYQEKYQLMMDYNQACLSENEGNGFA